MVNRIWPTAVAGKADSVSSVSALACHIGVPNSVNTGQILLVYGMLLTWHSRLPALVNRFSPIHLEAPLSPVGETSGWSWCCGRWSIFGPLGFGPQTIRQGEVRSPRQHRHQLRRDTPGCLKWKTHITRLGFLHWFHEMDLSEDPIVEANKSSRKSLRLKFRSRVPCQNLWK